MSLTAARRPSGGSSGRPVTSRSGQTVPMADLPVPDNLRPPQGSAEGLTERVADADRDRTVAQLREHVVEGRLTLDEFSERVGSAFEARTRADLLAVMADLPEAPVRRRSPAGATQHNAQEGAALARRGHERAQHQGPLAHQREDECRGRHGWVRHGSAPGRDRRTRDRDHRLGLLGRDRHHRARGVRRRAAGVLVHGRARPEAARRAHHPGLAPDRGARLRRHGGHRRQEPPEPVGQAARPCRSTSGTRWGRRRGRSRRTGGARPGHPAPAAGTTT